MDPLYEAIGWLLAFFYGLVPNLGVAIILLTCTVMLVLFPLTAKQARSMLAMQEIQPELKKLQAKHKGDRQKMVEEQQKLFQEHKVNPLGGCLPLVAQFPIFISLFSVLRNPYKNVPVDSDLFRAFCGDRGEAACGRPPGPNHLEFLGMDLTTTALDASGGLFTVAPYFILVGLVILAGYFQSRQTQRTTPAGANPQMQMIGKVLPIGFGVFSLWFPAGLVLYFLVSNLWRLGQQEVIFRKIHLPHRERQAAKKGGGGKGETAPEVIDVVEAEPEEEAAEGPTPAQRPKQRPKQPRAATPSTRAEAQPGTGGRLRDLFRLPPTPNGEPAPSPAPPPTPPPKKTGSPPGGAKRSGSSQSQSGQARRRRNKKRKR
ncbi:MAG: YidC/Oxa1 family membrane protein insertase [Acidimicrobiia bacterium]